MTTLFREDDEQPDREVTLGIGSLLSIFFGMVLVCGIFFGFGYSIGRRNVQSIATTGVSKKPAAPAAAPDQDSPTEARESRTGDHDSVAPQKNAPASAADDSRATAKGIHPAPSPTTEPQGSSTPNGGAKSAPARNELEKPARPVHADPPPAPATLSAVPLDHRPVLSGKPRAGIGASGPPPVAPVDEEPMPGRPLMVQIAAVSRQEDAEVLAGALRKRGFAPQVKSGTADKFFHVQVGPFPDKAQAETMKQHLLADGYNAILK